MLETYPGLRLGNVLYFVLHAYALQARGVDYRVMDPGPSSGWRESFPGLEPFFIAPSTVKVTDRREHLPPSFLQAFEEDFDRELLTKFVREVLASTRSPERQSWWEGADDPERLTINVRRGDYYSRPEFRRMYGFDVVDYVRSAVTHSLEEDGAVKVVNVVSDDAEWCRTELGWLRSHADAVTFEGTERGIASTFDTLARARRLVITNSTFSYWGAFVSNVVHGDNHQQVWAPRLHSWETDGGRPWQHDPRWRTARVHREI